MRRIEVKNSTLALSDEVELFYEKIVTVFGTSAKVGVPKEFVGRRAYIIILKPDGKKLKHKR